MCKLSAKANQKTSNAQLCHVFYQKHKAKWICGSIWCILARFAKCKGFDTQQTCQVAASGAFWHTLPSVTYPVLDKRGTHGSRWLLTNRPLSRVCRVLTLVELWHSADFCPMSLAWHSENKCHVVRWDARSFVVCPVQDTRQSVDTWQPWFRLHAVCKLFCVECAFCRVFS